MSETRTPPPVRSTTDDRPSRGVAASWARAVAATGAALATVAVLILALGANPLTAARAVLEGSLGNPFNIGQTVTITGILILTGIAAAIPFTARLWNIGGEGQLTAGAIAAAVVGIVMPPDLPHVVLLPLCLAAAAIAGAAYAAIPGVLKARFDTSEIVTSLMLNFVAVFAATWVVTEGWPASASRRTVNVAANATLPRPIAGTLMDLGILVALLAVIVTVVLLRKSVLGFTIRAMGANGRASVLAGIQTGRVTVTTFVAAGMAAGLAGALIVLGRDQALQANFSANFGYLGIAVALVARLHPVAIVPAALLFAVLRTGSNALQTAVGLPPTVGEIIAAVLVLALMAYGVIRFKYPEGADAH